MIINNEQTIYEDEDYEVTEVCPHCMSEVNILWNPVRHGYQTKCPECGNRLMLCDLCRHRYTGEATCPLDCDYWSVTDTCKMQKGEYTHDVNP